VKDTLNNNTYYICVIAIHAMANFLPDLNIIVVGKLHGSFTDLQ